MQAVERSSSVGSEGQKITFNMIKSRLADLMYKITSMKFEDPADGETMVKGKLDALTKEIKDSFRNLEESVR